ncbi:MAG TPA: hypothetical protein VGQ57_02195 [Polyangiaceae bacterium]|nr:hypothetical protein [Polyangiaceae bacterium]
MAALVPVRNERTRRAGAGSAARGELDPLLLSLAVAPGPPAAVVPPLAPAGLGPVPAPVPLAHSVEEVVRRIAWGGDRRRGVARIELGGEYEGTAIVVRGDGRELTLTVEVRPGANAGELSEELVERLRARGLSITAEGAR